MARHGIADAHRDAMILLSHAAAVNTAGLIGLGDQKLSKAGLATFIEYIDRRCNREPVTRILGKRSFWDLELDISPDVLDPRADTETVIEAAIQHCGGQKNQPLRILDLGTGSGAIVCALAGQFPKAQCLGIDISAQACVIARRNADKCGLGDRIQIRQTDWVSGLQSRTEDMLPGPFDLIVSNPPYIKSKDIERLDPEVRCWDPLVSLDGGADGLQAYRQLAATVPPLMASGGWLIAEIGVGQQAGVIAIMAGAGLKAVKDHHDLGGHVRALAMQRAA